MRRAGHAPRPSLTPSPKWLLPILSRTDPASSSAKPPQGADHMTTSQTYQTDDDQLVHAQDHAIPDDSLTDLAEPDADPMAPDSDLADLAEPDADPTARQDLMSQPDGAAALTDSQPAPATAPGFPGFTPHGDDGAAEPAMADTSPGSPSLVSAAFTVPETVTDSHPDGDTASAAGPWNEIQAMFVDDPHASIERAAALVHDRVEEHLRSVTEQQHSIQSAWQADDAGTEELRVALQHYRTFWNTLDDLPAPA
jgi:hypothetical protein